jgi:hypothetical protein
MANPVLVPDLITNIPSNASVSGWSTTGEGVTAIWVYVPGSSDANPSSYDVSVNIPGLHGPTEGCTVRRGHGQYFRYLHRLITQVWLQGQGGTAIADCYPVSKDAAD